MCPPTANKLGISSPPRSAEEKVAGGGRLLMSPGRGPTSSLLQRHEMSLYCRRRSARKVVLQSAATSSTIGMLCLWKGRRRLGRRLGFDGRACGRDETRRDDEEGKVRQDVFQSCLCERRMRIDGRLFGVGCGRRSQLRRGRSRLLFLRLFFVLRRKIRPQKRVFKERRVVDVSRLHRRSEVWRWQDVGVTKCQR
jgi:hypothetical protein